MTALGSGLLNPALLSNTVKAVPDLTVFDNVVQFGQASTEFIIDMCQSSREVHFWTKEQCNASGPLGAPEYNAYVHISICSHGSDTGVGGRIGCNNKHQLARLYVDIYI